MDGWVSVISRRWKGEHERLCAMKRRLGSGRISPPVGFESATPWSEVGSANRSATRTLLCASREGAQVAYGVDRQTTKWTRVEEEPWTNWQLAYKRLSILIESIHVNSKISLLLQWYYYDIPLVYYSCITYCKFCDNFEEQYICFYLLCLNHIFPIAWKH